MLPLVSFSFSFSFSFSRSRSRSFSFSFSRSSFVGLAVRRLNHKLGLRSNSFDDRSSSLSFSPPLSLSLSLSLSCSFASLPLRNCRGTGGTGGSASSAAFRVETVPSDVEGRALEPLGERNELNNPPCARPEVAGVVEESGAGMRIEGRDFFRDGRVTEGTSGIVTREGEDGAVGIGGCGVSSAAGEVAGGSPRPGGSAGSGDSNDGTPFVAGGLVMVTSGTVGPAGTFMPKDAGSRSAAW